MLAPTKLSLKFLLLSCAAFALCCHCGQYESASKELNKYLSAISNGKEAKDYLIDVREKLNQLDKHKFRNFSDLRAAIESILALESIFNGPKCTPDELEIIQQVARYSNVDRNIDKLAKEPLEENAIRSWEPIDRIVYQACLDRANKCIDVWPEKFKQEYASMDSKLIDLAEFKAPFLERKKGMSNEEYMKYLFHYEAYEDASIWIDAYDHIARKSQQDAEKCKFFVMLDKYLLEPCAQYTGRLSKPILEQFEADSKVLARKPNDYKKERFQDDSLIPFYRAVAFNRACNTTQLMEKLFRIRSATIWVGTQERDRGECLPAIKEDKRYKKLLANLNRV